ncbi:cytochrome aa3 quinol oxidase subunit IV [Halobacillus karajensis]|uniref:Quinol oxidase subunit 4 n=1 Tax=Halobacillus karajensis TaxID=195088 RepID=A0A024P8J6_9BACI|nr:cytochrome aa3 quinol oxidase subunit IV [Halobacillus karajensis]CDQ20107.1 Quinol oxidase subunit 4 [Halobacillus karajensis]CDQ25230.1 Quinol oxidase subunit 4 [Halobacillus karajensis]CDQ28409.1 Quinol oxidase subunit 4 [Halobacillus karajensis]
MAHSNKRVPMNHVIGFILSLAMTLVAAWAAIGSDLPVRWVIIGIMILALLQAGVQLFMFMHVTEAESGNGHVPWNMMFHGFALAGIIVAGSLFTMSFGFDHNHGGDGGEQQHEQQHRQQDHSGH